MSKFGDDLIRSLKEAVDHAKGEGPGTEHIPVSPLQPWKSKDTQSPSRPQEKSTKLLKSRK